MILTAMFAMIPMKATTFPLGEVTLLDSPFKSAMELNASVLLKMEPDRFLHNTRLYAGLEPKGKLYGGWESRGIAGHSLGHYLTALALQYSATGDKRFRERIDYIVKEMAECQERYGDGYIGALPPLELKTLRDLRSGKVETDGGFGFKGGAWVPWYTEHKVIAGLKDAWLIAGCPQAKQVTLRLADWIDDVTKTLPPDQVQKMLAVEHGGMNEVFADLYAVTKEEKYLAVSGRFYHQAVLNPLRDGRDELPGKHANTQIPKVIGMARTFEVTGEPAGRAIAENFWNIVVNKYTFAMGGNSDREHFFRQEDAGNHLTPESAESCNTYNMLKLTEHLFGWEPKVAYADFYERALYNHIRATQDPKTGMYAYFMSLKPGHFRTFSTIDNSFWCCVGTGMENHTKYGEAIYFHRNDELFVNLFIPSKLNWKERGLVLEQRTHYPAESGVELTISHAPKEPLALKFRCPEWAAHAPTFHLNGKAVTVAAAPGSYAEIRRVWHAGDRVQFDIPLTLRAEPLKGDPTKVAFMAGPLTLAGDFGPAAQSFAPDHTMLERVPAAKVPPLITDNPSALTSELQPVPGKPMTWTLRGMTVRPYLDLPFEQTSVYFEAISPAEAAKRENDRKEAERLAAEEAARTIDSFAPGEQQSEKDHGFTSENSQAGEHMGRKWRHAMNNGYLEFTLKREGLVGEIVRLTFWGGDAGRTFDLLADGVKLATIVNDGSHGARFFTSDFPLPGGGKSVTLRLQAPAISFAGGLFGAALLRSK